MLLINPSLNRVVVERVAVWRSFSEMQIFFGGLMQLHDGERQISSLFVDMVRLDSIAGTVHHY